MRSLKQRPDLKVISTDKNLGPALMLTDDYVKMCFGALM